MTHKQNVERLCKALGEPWHEVGDEHCRLPMPFGKVYRCSCKRILPEDETKQHIAESNPTLTHADEVLVMLKQHLSEGQFKNFIYTLSNPLCSIFAFVDDYIVSPPTDLVIKACEFVTNLRKEK
jgi:hypothetical protein